MITVLVSTALALIAQVDPPTSSFRSTDARDPVPLDPPATWFTAEDYPPEPSRAGTEGTVVIRLAIDSRGAIVACAIVSSSGSDLLDAATCRLARERGRFRPALASDGSVTDSTFTFPVAWELDSPPLGSWKLVSRAQFGSGYRVVRCSNEVAGSVDLSEADPCEEARTFGIVPRLAKTLALPSDSDLVELDLELAFVGDGFESRSPEYSRPGQRLLMGAEAVARVASSGEIERCDLRELVPELPLEQPLCDWLREDLRDLPQDAKRRTRTFRRWMTYSTPKANRGD